MSRDGDEGWVAGLQSSLQRSHVAELHGGEAAQEALSSGQRRLLVHIAVLCKHKETAVAVVQAQTQGTQTECLCLIAQWRHVCVCTHTVTRFPFLLSLFQKSDP